MALSVHGQRAFWVDDDAFLSTLVPFAAMNYDPPKVAYFLGQVKQYAPDAANKPALYMGVHVDQVTTLPQYKANWTSFLASAHGLGISVHALLSQGSDESWLDIAPAPNLRVDSYLNPIITFNSQSAEKFDAVHFDIEPHRRKAKDWLDETSAGYAAALPRPNEALWTRYLGLVDHVVSEIQNQAPGLPLHLDVAPWWYKSSLPQVDVIDASTQSAVPAGTLIDPYAEIVLMSFRDTITGPNGTRAISQPAMDHLAASGKTWLFGTLIAQDDPPITYFEEGYAQLNADLNTLYDDHSVPAPSTPPTLYTKGALGGAVYNWTALADVYIRDYPSDPGTVQSSGVIPFWDSSDIFVYQAQLAPGQQPAHPAKAVKQGQEAFIYVRVTNKGPAVARQVRVRLQAVSYPGTQFVYPVDWRNGGASHVPLSATPVAVTNLAVGQEGLAEFLLPAAKVDQLFFAPTGSLV